uniref:Uncharacterized protein n=1 Tax=Rhizophora mucronata TaxID=61149 RepID=A0A2P2QBU7_RHIMU
MPIIVGPIPFSLRIPAHPLRFSVLG